MTKDPTPPPEHPDELLADYADGSLDAAQRQEVERHLSSCAQCSEDLAHARRARVALSALPELDVPVGVTRPVVEGRRHRGARRSPLGGGGHRSSRAARVTWAVGAAAAAAVIAVFAWSAVRGGPTPQEGAAPGTVTTASGVRGAEVAPGVHVIHQSTNYTVSSIKALATRLAKNSPSSFKGVEPAPPEASPSFAGASPNPVPAQSTSVPLASGTPTPLGAVACVQQALQSSSTAGLIQLIQASFEGKPAYIAVFAERSASTDLITVWVVSASDCGLLNYTSTRAT